MVDEANHPLARAVSKHWDTIHNLTGNSILLVAFQTPTEWTEAYKAHWRKALGAAFDQQWQEWQQGIANGVAYNYLTFCSPPIIPNDLPCLLLFTDVKRPHALLRQFPKDHWSEEEQYDLLKDICAKLRIACDDAEFTSLGPDDRLAFLKDKVTSLSARVTPHMHHIAAKALNYFGERPVTIVSLAVNCGILLVEGASLPLAVGPAILNGLKAIKKLLNT